MTQDERGELAKVRETLRHIEAAQAESKTAINELRSLMLAVMERVVRLETRAEASADLPSRVRHNETDNAARAAYREGEAEAYGRVRNLILAGIAVMTFVTPIATTLILSLVNGE